jgi:hypothetical protein
MDVRQVIVMSSGRAGSELSKLSKSEECRCAACACPDCAIGSGNTKRAATQPASNVDPFAAIEAGINGPCAWPQGDQTQCNGGVGDVQLPTIV